MHRWSLLPAIVAAAAALVVATYAFPHGSTDLDEVAYVAQAKTLQEGHLTLGAASHVPSFLPYLSAVHGHSVVFKDQPAWPGLIAASERLVGSTLPLRVALAGAAVLAVYAFAWELLEKRRVALVAAWLIAASPFLWIQSATLLGYQLSFVLSGLTAAALIRSAKTQSRSARVLGGALLGLAVLNRPFDAVSASAPVAIWAAWYAWKHQRLGAFARDVAIGLAPFVILTGVYNQILLGRPWRLVYNVNAPIDRFGFGWRASFVLPNGGHVGQIHYTVGRAFAALWGSAALLPRFIAAAPLVVACGLTICVTRRRDSRVWLLVAMGASVFAAYFFWWGTANALKFHLAGTLGPFYHYLVLIPLVVLASWGIVELKAPRLVVGTALVVAAIWVVPFSEHAVANAKRAGDSRAKEVTLTNAPGPRLVMMPPVFPDDPYLRFANQPNLDGDLVVAVDAPGRRLGVVSRFPGRTPYLLRSYRRPGDPFGPTISDRVVVAVVHAQAVEIDETAAGRFGRVGQAYLRVGDAPPLFAGSGGSTLAANWRITRDQLPADGRTVEVAAGVTIAAPSSTTAPNAITDAWFECRFEARATTAGIDVLTPCDGYQHYQFANGRVTSREELGDLLRASASPG